MNTIMVTQIGGEPRVDSRQLAKQLGTKHKNPMALIERYLAKFEEFGVVPFQTEKPLAGTAGGRPERFGLLNEDQAFFLLSLSRNTDRIVELKASLIMAFLTEADAECGRVVMRSAGAQVTACLVDSIDDITRWHGVNNGQVCRAFSGVDRREVGHG